MFTPQELQEKTFTKAVFGGYDMGSVDDFLEPLTEDYITLHKENTVLKSKMKILVEKLEEYRAQEESMRKALLSAQLTSDQMVAEAEKKCAQLLNQTENALRDKTNDVQQQMAAEEERIERAKQAALNFIEIIEKDVSRHLDLLNNLKMMNLSGAQPPKKKVYDFEKEPVHKAPPPPVEETPVENEAENESERIIAEITQNLEKVIGPDDDGDLDKTRVAPAGNKFQDLKFGKNYDPNME